MTWRVLQGDCVEVMAGMADASVDAIVTDPPYGLEFMGKAWDSFAGERNEGVRGGTGDKGVLPGYGRGGTSEDRFKFRQRGAREFQAFSEAWAREALRVLKPGGHMIAAGGSRTYHRLTAGVEDAGFEIRDCIVWHFGSGFPKSLNVSEALRRLPPCTCDVSDQVGAVDATSPASTVGAGVGAEAGSVPLAGLSANGARGVGSNVGTDASDAVPLMQSGVEQGIGDVAPVVLGASAVAGVAAGDEVAPSVSGVEVDPEALRDDVVRNRGITPAVGAGGIAQDVGADRVPAEALVAPLPTTPSGVPGSGHSAAIGDGHAGLPAVDGDALPVAVEAAPALGADEHRHDLKCGTCGGVRRHLIPEGLGTALKPAAEFWVVARKPLSGTVAATVLEHGTGALNIDGCRVGFRGAADETESKGKNRHGDFDSNAPVRTAFGADNRTGAEIGNYDPPGRWPPNVVLSHTDECRQVGTRKVNTSKPATFHRAAAENDGNTSAAYGKESRREGHVTPGYGGPDGTETVPAYSCSPECPVRLLDEQTGELTSGDLKPYNRTTEHPHDQVQGGRHRTMERNGDSGGASRFFATFNPTEEPTRFKYSPKTSSAERNAGLDGFEVARVRTYEGGEIASAKTPDAMGGRRTAQNVHPTVKPIDLMRWLVRLVTPPGGTILDPFTGSGSTGAAAVLEGFGFIGLEREQEYVDIARARIAWWARRPGVDTAKALESVGAEDAVKATGQGSLFDEGEAA